MQWNLARLAETLLPLIQPDDLDKAVELASAELGRFPDIYRAAWLNGMRAKLGLVKETAEDQDLFETMLSVLQEQSVDYTLYFRHLSEAAIGAPQKLRELFVDPTQIDGCWSAGCNALKAKAERRQKPERR